MYECCGYQQETPFCAYCGGRLAELPPLEQLLEHCKKTLRLKKGAIKKAQQLLQESLPNTREKYEKRVGHAERNYARWEKMRDALQETLNLAMQDSLNAG